MEPRRIEKEGGPKDELLQVEVRLVEMKPNGDNEEHVVAARRFLFSFLFFFFLIFPQG